MKLPRLKTPRLIPTFPKLTKNVDLAVFRESRPVILTVLMNKVGAIGISLIPVLLVERRISPHTASGILGSIRFTLILGTLSAGWITERFGARATVLGALLLSAIGLGLLPLAHAAVLIAACGIVAQYGEGLMRIALRVVLTDSVPKPHHKEALGWMRTANNLGQIFSYGLGSVAGGVGVIALFLFDAVTSLAAFGVGYRILPRHRKAGAAGSGVSSLSDSSAAVDGRPESRLVFVGCALILCGYTFFYELYLAAVAGRLELLYPSHGLRWFSLCMVLNTVLCTLFSVPAARYFRRPSRVFPIGIFFTMVAAILGTWFTDVLPLVFLGAFCITASEVATNALTQYTLIRLVPASKHGHTWYSAGMTLSHFGRILAAAIAFPWFVRQDLVPSRYLVLLGAWALIALIAFSMRRAFDRAAS